MDWLLTTYPLEPFGESNSRAEVAQAGLRDLGRLLLETVFRSSPQASDILARINSEPEQPFTLSIVSTRPEFLALPWELLNESDSGYLASRAEAVCRQFIASDRLPRADTGSQSESQFNILMLCPPGGRGIATESLAAMESLEVEVSLDCLRPPTVEALEAHLAGRAGYYHLLHLDGLLPDEDGSGIHGVGSRERIAAAVSEAGIPAVLLACSAPDPAQRLAAALMHAGIPEVAVLPVPLRGSGRKLFADALYAGVAKGLGVAASVSAARRALMEHPHRPSAAGPLVSWDWITPLSYRSTLYQPTEVKPQEPEPVIPGMLPATPEPPPRQLPRGGPYGLIGRHREILDIQGALESNAVVLLHGPVGVGKSEVALGLAAWLEKSGGMPGGVFHTNFDVGAGLEKALHEIGTALAGLEFGDLSSSARRAWLLDYLRQTQALLVWDGVENLSGFPNAGAGLLEESELNDLNDFLNDLSEVGGRTRVILISRRLNESWLSAAHGEYSLNGLNSEDRIEFATRLMEESGVDPARLGPEFIELLDLLEGHPLAMEVAIPLMNEVPSSVLLSELRRGIEEHQGGPEEEGRPVYLTALMEHAFQRMPRRSRTHLPFLSLFRNRVMMDILTHITQESTYRSVMGEELGWGACRTLLRSARSGGFSSLSPQACIRFTRPWDGSTAGPSTVNCSPPGLRCWRGNSSGCTPTRLTISWKPSTKTRKPEPTPSLRRREILPRLWVCHWNPGNGTTPNCWRNRWHRSTACKNGTRNCAVSGASCSM